MKPYRIFQVLIAHWLLFSSSLTLPSVGKISVDPYQDILSLQQQLELADWQVSLSREWDVLGPFPIQAREQHSLSPAFPLNSASLLEYDATKKFPSQYAKDGWVTWSKVTINEDSNLSVSFPDVRWDELRSTEGWAALQYHSVLRTNITIHPPQEQSDRSELPPKRLYVDIQQGSYFTILPAEERNLPSETFTPEWHAGNIYGMHRAPPNVVELPIAPYLTQSTRYVLLLSGDYEIRLFGDPRDSGDESPTLKIGVHVSLEHDVRSVVREASHDIVCDFLDGYAFGNSIGVGLRSLDDWWTVQSVSNPVNSHELKLSLLEATTLAPTQTRIVPIVIEQSTEYLNDVIEFSISLTDATKSKTLKVNVQLELRHIHMWTSEIYEDIRATFFFATSHPTLFLAKPPVSDVKDIGPPVLALRDTFSVISPGRYSSFLFTDGAGVDIQESPFWAEAIPRQSRSWVVIPPGRTEWGLDWHGPSASEAWSCIDALSKILQSRASLRNWSYPQDSKVILIGHSNGGQGVWYLAGRYPDKVLGCSLIPAAGYLKSQAYIPLTQSWSAHFIDPQLRAILESSLTPDDNDLFLSNLVNLPVLAIHGGSDTNVPTWHGRAYASILKTWSNDANVTYREDHNQPHWYPSVFDNPNTQEFLDKLLEQKKSSFPLQNFTLTIADPRSSGSLHGFRILSIRDPGRLSRLTTFISDGLVYVKTSNVLSFSIITTTWEQSFESLFVDGVNMGASLKSSSPIFYTIDGGTWIHSPLEIHPVPNLRVQNVLDTHTPISILIPSVLEGSCELSAATRIAHNLNVYHKLDAKILSTDNQLFRDDPVGLPKGNIIIISCGEHEFLSSLLKKGMTDFVFEGNVLKFREIRLVQTTTGVLFTHPHPNDPLGLILIVFAYNRTHMENILRLVPLRTGVAVPDWIIIDSNLNHLGAAGVMGAGVWKVDGQMWASSSSMTWLQ